MRRTTNRGRRNIERSDAHGLGGSGAVGNSDRVAHAAMRLNHTFRCNVADLATHQTDKSIDRIHFDFAAITPECLDDGCARYYTASVANEKFEEPEFRERQANLLASAKGPKRVGLE